MAAPELGLVELLRWCWRQLTSMRTALVLLLLLALAAIPGSVIPQTDTDAFAAQQWKDDHPKLAPVYEKLGLFSVFDSVWFSAIYLLLVISLVGCILPRTKVYWKALRAKPPAAPRHLSRLPHHATYTAEQGSDEALADAARVLRKRRYRVRVDEAAGTVSAEKGHLREAGNLVFHISILVVLAGFAVGSLWGYQGGVIVMQGQQGFSNTITQYDDFVPGSMLDVDDLEPFHFKLEKFDIEWLESGPRQGMAQKFGAHLRYTEEPGAEEKTYKLRVNHPLSIGDTDVFLIGHGYAPHITVRDADGEVVSTGPTPFLPEDMSTFQSFGVVKVPGADPQIGLEGLLFPTYMMVDNVPMSIFGDDRNPLISMQAYVGDLGFDKGSQSIYVLNKDDMELLDAEDGGLFRVDLCPEKVNGIKNETCQVSSIDLPDGAGSVSFDDITPWVRVQISKTPGTSTALIGVILALLGLLGSLFVRPRRVWVRVRREDGETLVEVGGLERSNGGDATEEIEEIVAQLNGRGTEKS